VDYQKDSQSFHLLHLGPLCTLEPRLLSCLPPTRYINYFRVSSLPQIQNVKQLTFQCNFLGSSRQSLAHSKWWIQNLEAVLGREAATLLHMISGPGSV